MEIHPHQEIPLKGAWKRGEKRESKEEKMKAGRKKKEIKERQVR